MIARLITASAILAAFWSAAWFIIHHQFYVDLPCPHNAHPIIQLISFVGCIFFAMWIIVSTSAKMCAIFNRDYRETYQPRLSILFLALFLLGASALGLAHQKVIFFDAQFFSQPFFQLMKILTAVYWAIDLSYFLRSAISPLPRRKAT